MAASSFKDAAGNIFLLGNNFELGISPDGNFGTSDAPPVGYYTGVGETQVGMVYNPTGFSAAHNATNVDFFLPGTPLELFSVGYTHGGTTSVGTNYYIGSNKATPGGTGSLHEITDISLTNTSSGNTLSATYVGLFNANLQVTITYSFNVNDLYYSANVTLKNIGNIPMNDARYLRMVNPDNTTDYTGNYNTVNTIQSQQPGSGASLVLAQNPTSDAWQTATGSSAIFGYYSTDPNTRVSILSGLPSTTNNSALSPFNSGFYTTAPAVGTTTNANDTIVIDYDAGTLAAGASKSFNYSSLLTNNVAATVAAINSNTPPTFTGGVNTGLTLAENASTTTITNAMLTVVDAQQGATLLTYTVTTTPTKGTLTRSGVTLTANATFTQADINNGLIQYTPTTGVNGSDSLIFDVSDGAGGILSAQTFNLTITAPAPVVNNPPVAVDDTGNAIEAGGNNNSENASPATGNVLTNDTDVDGRALSVSAIRTGNIEGSGTAGTVGQVIAGNYGNLTLNANGSYTYVVNDSNSTVQALKLGDTLTESFNYTVFDSLLTDTGVLTITINGSNDSPSVTNLNGDSSTFLLGSSTPVLLDVGQNAVVTDVDTTNYNNTTISVSFAPGSLGSGIFSVDGTTVQSGNDGTISVGELVSVSGVTIGTVTANDKASNGLAISLNTNATATSIQTLLQNLYYIENSSDTTGTGDRVFNIQINEPNTTAMTPAVVKLTEKIPVPSLSLASDSGSSATDAITNSGVVNVSGLVSNATWQYSTDNGVNWITGSGTAFTLTGDGNKSVIARQIDAAGNVGLNSNTLVFTLDSTVATPSLALANDTGSPSDAITSDGHVSVSNLETGASWQYSQDSGVNWTTGSGSNFNLIGDGDKSVIVRQTDVAGNVSSNSNALNFTLDTSIATPTLTLANDTGISNSDGITNNGLVNVSNLETGASWQYSDSGTGWVTGSGSSFTLTGDGVKSVVVSQTDVAGNVSSNSNALNFTLDSSVATPVLTLTSDTGSSNTDGITNNGAISVANLESGASWQYSQDNGTNWITGSGSSFTLTGDGVKSVLVRQTDIAGNLSPNGTLTFTLDTSVSAPILTLTNDTGNSNTDNVTNDGTVSVANLEAGASWQYSQDNGTNWVTGSGSSFTLTGDGVKSVLVRQMDSAGNLSTNGALTFTLDTSVNTPVLTLTNDTGNSNTDNITNDGTVSVANLEAGASWQYSQDGGTNWITGSGSSFTLTGDGVKSVLVRQTDTAGNLSSNGTLTFTLDTNVNTPVLTLNHDTGSLTTDGITKDGTVDVANLEAGASWQYSQDGGTNWITGSGSSFTLAGDGTKSVLVRQTDVAGNVSSNSNALNFTLDTSVAAPILTLTHDTGISNSDGITRDGTVGVANLEAGASWQYSQDGGTNWITGSGSSFTLAGDGTKSVLVRQTDVAGNVSSNSNVLNFTLDTSVAAPVLTLTHDTGISNSDGITRDGTVGVANLEAGASWQYSQDGGTNWITGSGSSFTLTGDGTKSVLVRQTDVAGNASSNSNVLNFTLDTSVASPILTLTHDTGISNSDGITRDGTVSVANLEAGASWQYSQDGGTNWITGSGSSFTLTGDGTKSVLVRQTDIAGNLSANGALTFNLDTNINTPVLTLINDTGRSNTDGITRDGSVSVANLEAGARWQYSQDGGVNWTTGSGSSFTLTGDGYKSVMVRQTDIAGNTSLNSSALTFTLKSTESTPILTLNNDTGSQNNDRITSDGTVNISDLTHAVSWQYSLDNGSSWTVGSGSSFVLFGDGNKSVIAQKMDAAGNVSTSDALNFTLDTSAVTLSLALELDTGKNDDNITSDGTVIVSGIENGASWQYSLDDGINWTKGSGTSFTLVGDGDKSVLVEQTDVAGNTSSRSEFNFTLDSTVISPTLTLTDDTGISTTDRITNNGSVNVAGLENGASWEYSLDNGKNWFAGNGSSFTLTGDGNKSVITRQTDIAGNMSANSAPLNFILDSSVSAPTLTLNTDTGNAFDSITSDGTVNVSGLENGAIWEYSTDNGSIWKLGSGSSLTLTGDGDKSVIVHQTDTAGNISPNSVSLNFTLDSIALPPELSLENDTGNSNTDAITRDGRVNVFNLENGATWQYSQDGGLHWISGQGNGFTLTGNGYKSVVVR